MQRDLVLHHLQHGGLNHVGFSAGHRARKAHWHNFPACLVHYYRVRSAYHILSPPLPLVLLVLRAILLQLPPLDRGGPEPFLFLAQER